MFGTFARGDVIGGTVNGFKQFLLCFNQGCESFEEQQSAIDDLFFSKVDSGRTQEGQPHDAVLDKRLKQIKKEFQQIAGDEVLFHRV